MAVFTTAMAAIFAALGAAGTIGSSIIGNVTSAHMNQANIDAEWRRLMAQLDWEKKQQSIQLAFEREKARNQYQWNVEDLRAAGLNPALMYQGYGGAPVAGTSTSNAREGGGLTSAGGASNQNQVLMALVGGGLENVRSSLQVLKTMQHTQAREEQEQILEAASKYRTIARE